MGKKKIKRVPLANARGVYRVEVWNERSQTWDSPVRGKQYLIRIGGGQRELFFSTVPEALRALKGVLLDNDPVAGRLINPSQPVTQQNEKKEVLFLDVCNLFRKRRWSQIKQTTRDRYDEMIERDLAGLHSLSINSFNSKTVDRWLDESKANALKYSVKRLSFKHELDFIRTVFNFLIEEDEINTINPVKRRHYRACKVRERKSPAEKDLTWDECLLFMEQMKTGRHGLITPTMITIQYKHALRISEVAALRFEDVFLNHDHPEDSHITIQYKAIYRRKKGAAVEAEPELKNKKNTVLVDGKKKHRLRPEVYEALKDFWSPDKKGLMFPDDNGDIIKYKVLQNIYDRAFKKAGLNYRGTHVVRHGGTREILNMTGDLTLSQQHLGNSSISATMVYAQRDRSAFDEFTKSLWEKYKKSSGVKQG